MLFETTVVVTGDKELDAILTDMCKDDGPKAINAAMRKACRAAVKEIVLPVVMERIPHNYGFLESQVIVRAVTRSRGKIGYWVGFPDPLFQGDTHYAGYIEFGWDHYKGVTVEADSFLRSSLYENYNAIVAKAREYVADWIDSVNSKEVGG